MIRMRWLFSRQKSDRIFNFPKAIALLPTKTRSHFQFPQSDVYDWLRLRSLVKKKRSPFCHQEEVRLHTVDVSPSPFSPQNSDHMKCNHKEVRSPLNLPSSPAIAHLSTKTRSHLHRRVGYAIANPPR